MSPLVPAVLRAGAPDGGGRTSLPLRNTHAEPGGEVARENKKMKTMRGPTAAAAISVTFLLSNRAVWGHLPESGGNVCGRTVLEVGA